MHSTRHSAVSGAHRSFTELVGVLRRQTSVCWTRLVTKIAEKLRIGIHFVRCMVNWLKIMIRNLSKYIVTFWNETVFRMPCIKGNEFCNLKSYKFWIIFLFIMWNITSLQGHSSQRKWAHKTEIRQERWHITKAEKL